MDMDRCGQSRQTHDLAQLFRGDRTQAVRSNSQHVPMLVGTLAQPVIQVRKRVCRMHEAPLAGRRGRAAKSRMRVKHGEQRETQSRRFCGGHDAPCKLRGIAIGFARGVMMDVVEFGDGRVTGLGHFDVRLCRDRLERLGVDVVEKAVHRLAPRPETVFIPGRRLPRAPGKGALECMRMQIGHRRHDRARECLAIVGARVRFDGDDVAVVIDVDGHTVSPTLGQQRARREILHCADLESGTPMTATNATDCADVG